MMLRLAAAILITAIYLLSGINKIRDFDGTVSTVSAKLPQIDSDLAHKAVTVFVIALEIIAPVIIIYSALTGAYLEHARTYIVALAAFTAATTALFYYPPTPENQTMLFLHLSLIGGLIALYLVY